MRVTAQEKKIQTEQMEHCRRNCWRRTLLEEMVNEKISSHFERVGKSSLL